MSSHSLTVLLPVTRAWAMGPVVEAIAVSDIPRGRLILVLDAPGCEAWEPALAAIGFSVETTATGNPDPPQGRHERRERHRAMRRLTQALVPDGPLLCLEDDTIVPADVYAHLAAAGVNATAVQVGRHRCRAVGVHGYKRTSRIEPVTACGHYCLLTTGEAYKGAAVPDAKAIDTGHTSQIQPLVVDWECVCGHLTERGVLYP